MESLALEVLTLLFVVALVAGCIDTLAGGGGLIVIVLFFCTMPMSAQKSCNYEAMQNENVKLLE